MPKLQKSRFLCIHITLGAQTTMKNVQTQLTTQFSNTELEWNRKMPNKNFGIFPP